MYEIPAEGIIMKKFQCSNPRIINHISKRRAVFTCEQYLSYIHSNPKRTLLEKIFFNKLKADYRRYKKQRNELLVSESNMYNRK